jgi:hypothetical protein
MRPSGEKSGHFRMIPCQEFWSQGLKEFLLLNSADSEPIGDADVMGSLSPKAHIVAGRFRRDADIDRGPTPAITPYGNVPLLSLVPKISKGFDQITSIGDLRFYFAEV